MQARDIRLEQTLFDAICRIPLIDPHSHIDATSPTAKTLDDLLGYHYYTELAHSAGMNKDALGPDIEPRERVRSILGYLDRLDNTVQYSWFVQIAQRFFDFPRDRVRAEDADELWQMAAERLNRQDWEQHVFNVSNLEKVFLTNNFDEPLEGFDTSRCIPCLRTDDLVFRFGERETRQRLASVTGIEVGDLATMKRAVHQLFERFVSRGAKACAISLPPRFAPAPIAEQDFDRALRESDGDHSTWLTLGTFWLLAECCREFQLPFDLMLGVNRQVYRHGVFQGQDLFDSRTSMILYADLFNGFPEVTFCVSVLASTQNQELTSYAWIFPNVVTSGHWWYSNIPTYIEQDCRARLQAVPKTKQIGYYSDAYKLEFILPKYDMYRRILARVLAEDFVVARGWSEEEAVALARLLLRDNARAIFGV